MTVAAGTVGVMAYRNGRLPDEVLAPIPGEAAGCRLLVAAAVSFAAVRDEVKATYGWTPHVTSAGDAYRPDDAQERVFRDRYQLKPSTVLVAGRRLTDQRWWDSNGNGVREAWYRHQGPAAAVPGTSNHGWGTTVDVRDAGGSLHYATEHFRQFAEVAARHGWSNAEGKAVGEAWHWTHVGSSRLVANVLTVGGTLPTFAPGDLPGLLTPEDELSARAEQLIEELHTRLLGEGSEGLPHLHNKVDGLPEAVGENVWRRERISRAFPDGRAVTTPLQDLADAASRSAETAAQVGALTAALTVVASAQGLNGGSLEAFIGDVLAASEEGAARALQRAKIVTATTITTDSEGT